VEPDETRRRWAERSGAFSPAYYAYYGPDATSELVHGVLDRYLDRDARVLELGCSSGRHLSHLHDRGFENLSGIDLNGDALGVMAETYPELAAAGTFYVDAIERVVEGFEDGRFDAVYSVQTLQHVHPESEWVFEELVRITDDLLVTVENEGPGAAARGDGAADGRGPADDGRSPDRENRDGGPPSHGPGVNYVNGNIPLYYRDWNRIFTRLGLVQVDVDTGTGRRETLRAFRIPAQSIA